MTEDKHTYYLETVHAGINASYKITSKIRYSLTKTFIDDRGNTRTDPIIKVKITNELTNHSVTTQLDRLKTAVAKLEKLVEDL